MASIQCVIFKCQFHNFDNVFYSVLLGEQGSVCVLASQFFGITHLFRRFSESPAYMTITPAL